MNKEFWQGKRVLVTGHTGFKGSWLCLWLQKLGAQVVGYSLPQPTQPGLFQDASVADGMVSIEGDVRDLDYLQSIVGQYKPEIVFHLAAQPLVRYSYENPVETYSTNVMGTVNLFESIRQTGGVKAVVNVTSDKCYHNREWLWGYREDEAMGGYDPYSSSKGCSELVTAAYIKSYFNKDSYAQHGIAVASARAGNVIGGGDWAADRLIPDIIRAYLRNESVVIRNPSAVRPWQYVLEPLSGYLSLAQNLYDAERDYTGGWNFGPNEDGARPVSWVVESIANRWSGQASWSIDEDEQPHEAHYLKLDCAKAKMKLGWHPIWGLAESLDHAVTWYQGYRDGCNLRDMTLSQIEAYSALLTKKLEPLSK